MGYFFMGDMPAVVLSRLVSGSTYALLALGMVIIFWSTNTVNFAIGDIGTMSVFTAGTLISLGLPVVAALAAAVVIAGLVGAVSERVLIRPLGQGKNLLFTGFVITIALGLLIHAGIFVGWSTRLRPFPVLAPDTVTVLDIALAWNKIVAALIAAVTLMVMALFFKKTSFGIAMRATADGPGAARIIRAPAHSLKLVLGQPA